MVKSASVTQRQNNSVTYIKKINHPTKWEKSFKKNSSVYNVKQPCNAAYVANDSTNNQQHPKVTHIILCNNVERVCYFRFRESEVLHVYTY